MDESQARQSAVGKAVRRLMPFLILCYLVSFLDRVNVGFAALSMNEDLGFSPAVFGTGAGIFFVGYILFEVPSNLALHRFGARIWIARIMISWGIVSMAMALTGGVTSFYLLRFLLGVAEAGFFPGIILYLTYWFPARERAGVVAMFMAAPPLATVFGGPLSGALLELDGALGIAGWQWMFLIEGLPAVLLGLVTLRFLDDRPEHATWLTQAERDALGAQLAREAQETREAGYHQLSHAFTRPRVLMLGLIYFCLCSGLYGIAFWMPQVIQTFGLEPLEIGFLTAIPYIFAAALMVWWGRRSDRSGERIWHTALPLALAGLAFMWSAVSGPLVPTMLALIAVTVGIYAALGAFWALPTSILTGVGAAAGLALVNSIGNLGGLIAPTIIGVLRQETGDFTGALFYLALSLLAGATLTLLFGYATRGASQARPVEAQNRSR